MSAFQVSNAHINALVRARAVASKGNNWMRLESEMTDTDLGRMLLRENMASVACRYAHKGFTVDEFELSAYRASRPAREFSVVELLKALDCYEYQACEHNGWKGSRAATFCADLRTALIKCLPGYDDAPWGIE